MIKHTSCCGALTHQFSSRPSVWEWERIKRKRKRCRATSISARWRPCQRPFSIFQFQTAHFSLQQQQQQQPKEEKQKADRQKKNSFHYSPLVSVDQFKNKTTQHKKHKKHNFSTTKNCFQMPQTNGSTVDTWKIINLKQITFQAIYTRT